MEDLITTPELAKLLRLSNFTVRKWAREKKIPGVKPGREWRFKLLEVFQALDIHFIKNG